MAEKIIFSNSYSPRTGHNFAAEVFKVFTDCEVLIHRRSETRLTTLLNEYFKIHDRHIYHKTDKDFFDELFINDLREKVLKQSSKNTVLIKDTSFVGVEHIKRVFPNDIQILLLRDPLYTLKSLFKSMRFSKKGGKYTIKKIGYYIGLYPLYYALKASSKYLKQTPNLDDYTVIKYEDLVLKDDVTLIRLKKIFDCNKTLKVIKEEIDDISVINSSFTKEIGAKKIWESKKKTKKFNPINRKGHNLLVRLGLKIGSYKLRKKLGYV